MNDENDIELEENEELGDVGAALAKIKKLRDELAEIKKERQDYLDGWQRCKADAVNAKKDALQQSKRELERAKESFIEEILPALDSFDMAMGSPAWQEVSSEWRAGVGHIQTQLLEILRQNGVERYGKPGESFDHARHEAVQEEEDGDGESNTILKILRHGYVNGTRVVRPAQVIVRK